MPINFDKEIYTGILGRKKNNFYLKKIKLEIDKVDIENVIPKKKFLKNNYVVGDKIPIKKNFKAPKPFNKKNTAPPKVQIVIDKEVDQHISNNATLDQYKMLRDRKASQKEII